MWCAVYQARYLLYLLGATRQHITSPIDQARYSVDHSPAETSVPARGIHSLLDQARAIVTPGA